MKYVPFDMEDGLPQGKCTIVLAAEDDDGDYDDDFYDEDYDDSDDEEDYY